MDARHGPPFSDRAAYPPATLSHDAAGTSTSVRSSLSSIPDLQMLRTPYRYSGGTTDHLYGSTSNSPVNNVNSRLSTLLTSDPNAPSEKQEGARRSVASDSLPKLSPGFTIIVLPPSPPRASAPFVEETQTTPGQDVRISEAGRYEMQRTARDVGLAVPPRNQRRAATTPSSTPWAGLSDSAPRRTRYREPPIPSEDRPQGPAALAFSPDSQWIASGSQSGRIFLWTTDPLHIMARQATGSSVRALAFSPDGRQLASAHESGRVLVWSIEHNKLNERQLCQCSKAPALAISWHHDGTRIAICYDDTAVYTFDLQQRVGVSHPGFGGHPRGTLTFARFSPDMVLLAFNSPGVDSQCEIRNVANGTKRVTLPPRPDPPGTVILNAQFDALSARIVICSSNRRVHVFATSGEPAAGLEILTLLRDTGPAQDASFSPDGKLLLSATAKGRLEFWWRLSAPGSESGLDPVYKHAYRRMKISSVRFSPDSKFAACASSNGTVRCGKLTGPVYDVDDPPDALEGPGPDPGRSRSQSAGPETPRRLPQAAVNTHPAHVSQESSLRPWR